MRPINQEPDDGELSSEVTAALHELRLCCANCPEPGLLHAAQASVLPQELHDLLMRHVELCPICKTLMENLAALEEAPLRPEECQRIWDRVQASTVPELSSVASPRRARRWKLPVWPWPVAIASAAVVLVVFGIGSLRERWQPVARISQPGPPKTTPPSTAFRLEKAPVMLPASAVLVFRGADGGTPSDKELNDALASYKSDDYAQAAQRFERLARKYPRLAEAHFYLGVSQLFLNANEDAARALEMAHHLAKPPLVDESRWYLALAYERLGRANEARPLLESLCHGVGRKAARACLGLQVLR
jgi:TolA-binding protein